MNTTEMALQVARARVQSLEARWKALEAWLKARDERVDTERVYAFAVLDKMAELEEPSR